MINDFKAFIARGNVLDLAIAVIMGAAFGTIVKTFTDGIIMPFVGLATGGIDFKSQFYDLSHSVPANATPDQIQAAIKGGKPLVMYGQFINDIITFLIVAVVLLSGKVRGKIVQRPRGRRAAAQRRSASYRDPGYFEG